jgi:hypothetical protein
MDIIQRENCFKKREIFRKDMLGLNNGFERY